MAATTAGGELAGAGAGATATGLCSVRQMTQPATRANTNNKTKRRFLVNLQYRRFWVETENRWVRLRVSSAALRLIDKKGIDTVLADLRARGQA